MVFAAGFIDAIAGGGGFISLPAYFIAGVPPHQAIATNKLSAMMGTTLATARYASLGYIPYKNAAVAVLFAFCGSFIGARLALLISEQYFKLMLLVILPLTAFYLLKNSSMTLKNSIKGLDADAAAYKRALITVAVSFAIGIYDGLYGPGTGTFLIIGFYCLAGYSIHDANGMTKAINPYEIEISNLL